MNELKLLIIEDEKDFRESYAKQIKLFNLDQKEITVKEIFADNEEIAFKYLKEGEIDAAVVDLKLGNTDVEFKGSKLVNVIKSKLRFPAFIVTANPEKIEEEKDNQNVFFKIKVKGSEEGNFTKILNEFKEIHLTGITKILGKSGQIEKYLNDIFWNHLSNSVNLWISDSSRTSEQKQKSLLRYTLLYIQEYLEVTEDRLSFEHYHPAEIYITPCVKLNPFTGDIFEEVASKKNFIILTPSCDMAQGKAKDVLLAQIEKNEEGIIFEKTNIVKKGTAGEEAIKSAEVDLKKLVHNSYSNKYHFLPKYGNIKGGLINFQKLSSVRYKDLKDKTKYTSVASISVPFTKDIIARFSYYYSRQGSPDFKTDELYDSLF